MKRIIVAAVAAASLAAATPASAQLEDVADVNIKQPAAQCLTPVTTCVDQALDRAVDLVVYYYNYAGETIKNGPDLGSYCELIWENGCGFGTP